MSKDTMKVIEALRCEVSNLYAALKELHFCSARVRSATFRSIDRKQFDKAVEAAEKALK